MSRRCRDCQFYFVRQGCRNPKLVEKENQEHPLVQNGRQFPVVAIWPAQHAIYKHTDCTLFEEVPITYYGDKNGHTVWREGRVLRHEPSLKVWNHSPTGFSWGYGGSGPSQLALALLLDVTGDAVLSSRLHQAFRWGFVAQWQETWTINSTTIREWIAKQEPRRMEATDQQKDAAIADIAAEEKHIAQSRTDTAQSSSEKED